MSVNYHKCTDFKGQWATCVVCEGRLHKNGCTTKRNIKKDCCKARHQMLFDLGIKIGITDSSFHMLDNLDMLDK